MNLDFDFGLVIPRIDTSIFYLREALKYLNFYAFHSKYFDCDEFDSNVVLKFIKLANDELCKLERDDVF